MPASGKVDRSVAAGRGPDGVGVARPSHYRCAVQTSEQIAIIESAYALEVPDVQWQYRLTDLVADQWGGTAASFLYDASEPTRLTCERVIVKTAGERSVVDAPRSIPLGDPALRQALFVTRPHLAQLVDLLGPGAAEAEGRRVLAAVGEDLHPGPFSLVLRTLDRSRRGLFFVLPSRPTSDRMRAMWGEVAVHVGLAYRLRSALAGTAAGGRPGAADPAVLRRALRLAAGSVLRDVALWPPVPVIKRPSAPRALDEDAVRRRQD